MVNDLEIDKFSPQSMDEFLYFNDLTSDRGQEALRDWVTSIPDESLAEAQVCAFYLGSLPVLKALIDIRGIAPMDFKVKGERGEGHNRSGGQRFLNNKPFSSVSGLASFCHIESEAEMSELFEMAAQIGLNFMTGVDGQYSELFESPTFQSYVQNHQPIKFHGDIPSIEANGTINQPELLNALEQKRCSSSYPMAYNSILCWVDNEVIEQKKLNLTPIDMHRKVKATMRTIDHRFPGGDLKYFNLPEDQAALEDFMEQHDKDPLAFKALNIDYGFSIHSVLKQVEKDVPPSDRAPYNPKHELSPVNALYTVMAQARQDLADGLEVRDGYSLCIAKVDEISLFEKGDQTAENIQLAQTFIEAHFPLGALAFAYDTHEHLDYSIPNWNLGANWVCDTFLMKMGDESNLVKHLLEVIPRDLIQMAYDKMSTISGKQYANANRLFGWSNEGKHIHLKEVDLDMLIDNNITFEDNTSFFVRSKNTLGAEKTAISFDIANYALYPDERKEELIQKVLDLGLWPLESAEDGRGKRPVDLADAIKQASRFKNLDSLSPSKIALRKYIEGQGPEQASLAAKTAVQWRIVKSIFGGEMDNYLKNTSKAIRRSHLADDLGI